MPVQETLEEVFEDLRAHFGEQVHTGLPGQIRSYDAASNTATVRPMLTRPIAADEDEEGEIRQETYPDLPRVRVCHLRWGNMVLAANLAEGDPVVLSFLEADPSAYLRTGRRSPPEHRGRHKIAYAICWPALAPDPLALSTEHANGMVLGKDGDTPRIVLTSAGSVYVYSDDIRLGSNGATKKVALAEDVESEHADIWAAINTHVHTGGILTGALTGTPNGTPLGAAGTVGATKVRAE